MIKALVKKLIHVILTLLVFIYIIFEELIWESIAKPIYDYLHSLKILQKLESYIEKMHRVLLLIIFLIMFIQVELLGIGAAIVIAQGKIYSGILLYASKIPIGAFTFWLFRISKEKLLTFDWFKALYTFVMWLIDKIKESEIYKNIKKRVADIKIYIKEFKVKYFNDKNHIKEKIDKIYFTIKKIFKQD